MNEAQKLKERQNNGERYAVLLHHAINNGELIKRGEQRQEAYTYRLTDGSVVTFWGYYKIVSPHK